MLRIFIPACILLASPGSAQDGNRKLPEAIEQARHLSITKAVPASQPAIDALMDRLDEATPRQRVEIQLLDIRNTALQGHYPEAIERIRSLLESSLDDDQRLHALRLAANLGINVGQHEWGFTQLEKALELVPEAGSLSERSRILSLAGFVHSLIGNHERALQYATTAAGAARQTGMVSERCSAGQGLAVAYRYAEQFEQAESAARDALQDCRQADDQIYLGTVELELAHLAQEKGRLDAAEGWVDKGLERLRKAVWVDGILTGEHLRARLAAARGEHRQAIELAENLIEQAAERELWERKAALHRLAGSQWAELDESSEAYRHMVAQSKARQRFLDQDRSRRLAILEVEFEVKRHEQEVELLREQKRVTELEAQTRRQQARVRWLAAGFAVFLFAILVLLLIHVLRERRHFRRLSQLDGLTRISNHTRFFDTARMLVEESHRSGDPLVLALGDIDHFKRVNDEHGHIAGDRALQLVARVLYESFTGLGHVGRIGGEEFAICLPNSRLNRVIELLDQVRRDLARIDYGGNGRPLTMSFGVAERADKEPLEDLRLRADEALYRAKQSGRNNIVAAGNASPE